MSDNSYDRIDRGLNRELNGLDRRLANGDISQEEHDREACELEREARAEYRDGYPDPEVPMW